MVAHRQVETYFKKSAILLVKVKEKKSRGVARLVCEWAFLGIAYVGEHWFFVLPQMLRSGYVIVRT